MNGSIKFFKLLTHIQTITSSSPPSNPLSEDANSLSNEGFNAPVYGWKHDALSDALCVGDTFATPTDNDHFDFYLLQQSRKK